METKTPVALLQGAGGISSQIEGLMQLMPNADPELLIIDTDPDKLVERLTKLLDKTHAHYRSLYN